MSQYFKVVGQSAGSSFQKSSVRTCAQEKQICDSDVDQFLFVQPLQQLFEGKSSTNIVATDDVQKFIADYFGSSSRLPGEFAAQLQKNESAQYSYTLQAFQLTNDDVVLDMLRGNTRVGNDLEGTWARPGSLSTIPVGTSDIANVLGDLQRISGN